MAFGDQVNPFGLRELQILPRNTDGTFGTPVPLTESQILEYNEELVTGTLRGNDQIVSTTAFAEGGAWKLTEGGIPLAALAVMTGRALTSAGSTGAHTATLARKGGDIYPYFGLRGRAINDDGSDLHVQLYMCKLTKSPVGHMQGGQYVLSALEGMALPDPANSGKIFDEVANETAAALPTT